MRPQLFIRQLHKWIGLILVIQLIFWFASGFLMSFMPIEEVRGSHILKNPENKTLPPLIPDYAGITRQLSDPALSASMSMLDDRPVIQVTTINQTLLFDATTAQQLSPLPEGWVRTHVSRRLTDEHQIRAINWLTETPSEARGRQAPLWQVELDGPEDPVLYLSPQTGQLLATRTDRWRLFDFLWMLHIMDYDEREDFNHPLLYLTALTALLFTLSGVVLLFYTLKKRAVKPTKSVG
jgi:uncharacterized iron-regulated membrane protein